MKETKMDKKEILSLAREVMIIESDAIRDVANSIDHSFCDACELILENQGKLVTLGVGKSGHIARKISATFSSVGVPSFFCDPAQALHGDMGQIEKKDILIIFSNSGNTPELYNMLKYGNRYGIKIIGVASKPDSILLKASDIKIILPKVKEADVTGIVPTSSTSIALLFGDCMAATVMHQKKFSKEKFKVYHPGGNIGKSLLLAKDIMLSGPKMPVINYKKSFKEALKIMSQKKLGMIVITKKNFISGLVTDGDLRRQLNKNSLKNNLENFTNKRPMVVNENMPASKALAIMNEKKITSLLVVSDKDYKKEKQFLKGIIHIHLLLKNGIQ